MKPLSFRVKDPMKPLSFRLKGPMKPLSFRVFRQLWTLDPRGLWTLDPGVPVCFQGSVRQVAGNNQKDRVPGCVSSGCGLYVATSSSARATSAKGTQKCSSEDAYLHNEGQPTVFGGHLGQSW